MRWRAVSSDCLIMQDLDGDLVVRNDLTGSTHLLAPLQAEVLRTLMAEAQGLTAAELAARLADPGDSQEDWRQSIEATLSEFQRLGLAAPSG
jgi:PqqD family protein of HPr-rel-A system